MISKYLYDYPTASEREKFEHYYTIQPIWYLKQVYENFKKGFMRNFANENAEKKQDNLVHNNREMQKKIDDMVNELKTIRE